jgi:hypothetical protein
LSWRHCAALDPRTLDRPEQGSTFKTLRLTSPERQETYRVTHLGDNLSQRCCYFYTRRFAYQLPELAIAMKRHDAHVEDDRRLAMTRLKSSRDTIPRQLMK